MVAGLRRPAAERAGRARAEGQPEPGRGAGARGRRPGRRDGRTRRRRRPGRPGDGPEPPALFVNGFFPAPIGGNWFNDANGAAARSYDVDWWGKHRALVAAALGEANARQAEAAQAAQALAASVAQSYFRLQMLWARQDNVNALAAVQRELVAGRKARIAHGLASSDALRSAELDLGVLEEQAARWTTQAAREREVLRALVGGDAGRCPTWPARRRRHAATPCRANSAWNCWRAVRTCRPRAGASRPSSAAWPPAKPPSVPTSTWWARSAWTRLARQAAALASRTPLLGATLDLPLFDSGRLNAQLGSRPRQPRRTGGRVQRGRAGRRARRGPGRRDPAGHRTGSARRTRPRSTPAASWRQRRGAHEARPADRAGVLQAKMACCASRTPTCSCQDAACRPRWRW
jgi:multidrug efflux system outer membrane protein